MSEQAGRPERLRAPKGVAEYVGSDARQFLAVRDALVEQARVAGYTFLELPIFEDTALFVRGVGESTDVVGKEMFTFEDRAGRSLTLRPEGTAGAVRAVIEHGLDSGALPVKVSYAGPFFRAERPQLGRYRQFTQVGVEAIGSDDPTIDADVIAVADAGYRALGLQHYDLLLNSLGCRTCRAEYRELLLAYWEAVDLDEPTRERARINPLRVLDDKRPALAATIAAAPVPADHLCADCTEHLFEVQSLLDRAGIPWQSAPRLVRGLDYYTRTTFEFSHTMLGAQSGIGGGGRYDGLVGMLGGADIGGVGFGLGVDRTLIACREEGVRLTDDATCDVFVIALDQRARPAMFAATTELRTFGIRTEMAVDGRSMRSAMKSADRLGAAYAIIVGERDFDAGSATVRNLTSGDQQTVSLDVVTTHVREAMAASSAMEGIQ